MKLFMRSNENVCLCVWQWTVAGPSGLCGLCVVLNVRGSALESVQTRSQNMEVDFVMEPPWTQTTAPETSVFKVGNSHHVITAVIIIITIISIIGISIIISRVYANQN